MLESEVYLICIPLSYHYWRLFVQCRQMLKSGLHPYNVQKRTHMSPLGILQSIRLLRAAAPWRPWTNCVEFPAEAAEPCSDGVGGARTLHLPALTVPHFSTSQHL